MGRLDGKVAIVTGGSKGIGFGIAQTLGREGARIVIGARAVEDLERAAAGLRKEAIDATSVHADVSKEADADHLVKETVRKHGRVDILVNNAGVGVFKPVLELSIAEFDRMWGTNMRGVFLMSKAVLPHMQKGGGGDIVNIASLAGKNTFKNGAGYCATKWALRGFAGSMMLEVREHNIRVVTICPGSVDTSFLPRERRDRTSRSLRMLPEQ